jgi:hypothetical protein
MFFLTKIIHKNAENRTSFVNNESAFIKIAQHFC